MTDPFRDGDFRDEFEWEKEIRKDDDRVHDYLAELPRYIDLPDEDKVISKRIRRRGSTWDDDFDAPSDDDYDDDYDDVPEEDFYRNRDGSDVYMAASNMAIELTEYFAVEKDQTSARTMMRALTLLGKLMARSLDVLRLEDGDLITFRIALAKRFLADLNELIGEYEKFPEPVRDKFLKDAFAMRDDVLAKIRQYRRDLKRK
ncbi:MAG: hypothetical protein IKQ16_03120 [Lentisphaeria bacterium]|jgi:hypothetical protein|nr:hypothetical protein [Lentisphaeria bacterium]